MTRSRILTALFGAVSMVAATLAAVSVATPVSAAALQEVTNFGTNPSNLRMFVYVPATVQSRPPVVVAAHYCHGDGPAFYAGSQFAALADRYGFIVIYPSVTQASDGCFDVASPQALRHDGGSDPQGIVSMVRYVHQRYHGDPARTFATGVSSGAMMTNVLLGAYPDVFAAGSAFAGVPFACFAGSDSWNTACANGQISRTAQQWGDLVRAAYPAYTGPRPRMQLWHGTDDTVLHYNNFAEEIKQWTNVLGSNPTPASTDQPQPGWTRTRYTNSARAVVVEAISMQGVPHNLPVQADAAIRFFGLDSGTPTSPAPTATTSPTPTPTAGPQGCAATYSVASSWPGGFVAGVRVTAGSRGVTGWTVTLALPAGTAVTNSWNGTFSASGGTVRVTNVGHNGQLGAGQSTDFGFQGSGADSGITASCSPA